MLSYELLTEFKHVGAILEGHFVLKSGLHSDTYLNKDALYVHTIVMQEVGSALSKLVLANLEDRPEVVVGPAIGGVILAQWTAYALDASSIYVDINEKCFPEVLAVYAEKDLLVNGAFVFNRGYGALVAGKRCVLVEDIITTGGSIMAVASAVERLGGKVEGIFGLVNRGNVQIPDLYTLASMEVDSWLPDECPLCKQGIQINSQVGHGRKQ